MAVLDLLVIMGASVFNAFLVEGLHERGRDGFIFFFLAHSYFPKVFLGS